MRESWTRITSLMLVRDAAFVEGGIPGHEHRFRKIDVVAHDGMEPGIGRAVLEALVDVWPQLGLRNSSMSSIVMLAMAF